MRIYVFIAAMLAMPHPSAGQQTVDAFISDTERLPRQQRLPAYETALARRGISPIDRTKIVEAFAEHARRLSPLYQRSTRRWDPQPWHRILREGWTANPNSETIAWAYCQLLINEGRLQDAQPIAAAFCAAHPEHHHANAWNALCMAGSNLTPERITFPLHFCVLTRNPAAHQVASEDQCKRECEILNETFRTIDGDMLVKFSFKSFTPFAVASTSTSTLIEVGDSKMPYSSDEVARSYCQKSWRERLEEGGVSC